MKLVGMVFVAAGVFASVGAIGDLEWFMNSRRAQALSARISRKGARILYAAIGLTLVVLGILFLLGVLGTPE